MESSRTLGGRLLAPIDCRKVRKPREYGKPYCRYARVAEDRLSKIPSNNKCGKVCRCPLFFAVGVLENWRMFCCCSRVMEEFIQACCGISYCGIVPALGSPCPLLLTTREGKRPTTRHSMIQYANVLLQITSHSYPSRNIQTYLFQMKIDVANNFRLLIRGRSPLRTTARTRLPTLHTKHFILPTQDAHISNKNSHGSQTAITDGTAC